MAVDFKPVNDAAAKWARETLATVKQRGHQLNIQHRQNSPSQVSSLDAMTARTKRTNGLVSRISFGFPKHMAYVHYGVGRNRPIGSGKESPKYIFDVVNKEMPKLVAALSDTTLQIAQRGIFKGFLK
jgi:hypothetical protein